MIEIKDANLQELREAFLPQIHDRTEGFIYFFTVSPTAKKFKLSMRRKSIAAFDELVEEYKYFVKKSKIFPYLSHYNELAL